MSKSIKWSSPVTIQQHDYHDHRQFLMIVLLLALIGGILVGILQQNGWWVIGLLLGAAAIVISWFDFSSGMIIYIASFVLIPKVINIPIPGLFSTLSPSRVILIALALPVLVQFGMGRLHFIRTPLDKWIGLVVGTTLVTLPFSISLSTSLPRFLGQLLEYWLLFYLVVLKLRTIAQIRRVLVGMVTIIGLTTLMGLFELFTGKNPYRDIIFISISDRWDWLAGWTVPGTSLSRVLGPYEHPIAFGITLAMSLPIIVWLIQTSLKRWRLILIPLIGTAGICILATVSRLSWIVTGIGLLAVSSLSWKKMALAIAALLVLSLIPLSITPGSSQMSLAQVLAESLDVSSPGQGLNQSAVGRYALIGNTLEVVQARPIFGYGLSVTKTLYDPSLLNTDPLLASVGTLENQYLVYFVDLGIVGAIPWLILNFAVIRLAWHLSRTAKGTQFQLLASALFASAIVYLVSLLGVGGYYQQIDPLFWILVGIISVISLKVDDRTFDTNISDLDSETQLQNAGKAANRVRNKLGYRTKVIGDK